MKPYFKLLRVKHYVKNVLLILPLVFGHGLSDTAMLVRILLGFIAFSLISSAIYIFNDIKDAEKDRQHPVKKNRPVASGAVPVFVAGTISLLLFATSLAVNAFASRGAVLPWVFLLLYAVLNIGYSMGLKDVPLVDVTILMSGFLLRLLYGSALVDIKISEWLYLTVVSLAFFMGLGKRRNELIARDSGGMQGDTRAVLSRYTASFLDKSMYMCLLLSVVFYSLWCVDASAAGMISGNYLLWTVPLVLLICMKYSMILEGKSDGDPVEVLFGDKWLMLLVGLFACAVLAILYL